MGESDILFFICDGEEEYSRISADIRTPISQMTKDRLSRQGEMTLADSGGPTWLDLCFIQFPTRLEPFFMCARPVRPFRG